MSHPTRPIHTIPFSQAALTDRLCYSSLLGKTCPSCGHPKGARKSLCSSCYFALPTEQRDRLYDRIGEGYELALFNAMTHLRCLAIYLPASPPSDHRSFFT